MKDVDQADIDHWHKHGYVIIERFLDPALVRERDGVGDGARLLLLPSAKLLTGPTAGRLAELAEQGATVYLSYFAGSTSVQRGSWIPSLGDALAKAAD